MKQTLLAILAFLSILITSNHLFFAQTVPVDTSQKEKVQAAAKVKLKKKVEKIGIGGKITVITLDERDFYGSVSSIEADGFQIVKVDSKQTADFKFTELKKIFKGDGEKNPFLGKRVNPQKGWLYGLAIFGTLFVILGIALTQEARQY